MITSRNLSFIDWTLRDIAPSPPSQGVLRYFALVRWFALITVGAQLATLVYTNFRRALVSARCHGNYWRTVFLVNLRVLCDI